MQYVELFKVLFSWGIKLFLVYIFLKLVWDEFIVGHNDMGGMEGDEGW